MLPLLFVPPSRTEPLQVPASTSRYHFSSPCPRGQNLCKCLSALLRCNGRNPSQPRRESLASFCQTLTLSPQFGAPLRSHVHLHLYSAHPSQHDIPSGYPTGFLCKASLRLLSSSSHLSVIPVCRPVEKGSTCSWKCQPDPGRRFHFSL